MSENKVENRYTGRCCKCLATVEIGAGFLAGRDENGRTLVQHKVCSPPRSMFADLYATIQDGSYAVPDAAGKLHFFHVTKGNKFGVFFITEQAGPEQYPVRNVERKLSILQAIAADPLAASTAYGKEIGVCGLCGRTLTDPVSRERGIGPICAKKLS